MNLTLTSHRRSSYIWNRRPRATRALAFLVSLFVAAVAVADPVLKPSWGVDGEVQTIAIGSGVTYIGGNFTMVAPYTGMLAVLDGTTGRNAFFPPPVSGGNLSVIISDGAGGWFIGGNFSFVGSTPKSVLAHIHSDGTLDSGWNVSFAAPAQILGLALVGNTLYLGGDFALVGGQTRINLAAVNATTGAVLSWNPQPDSVIETMTADASGLYVGGQFHNVGGQARNYVAALDPTSGAATTWNPNPDDFVYALALNGSTVYVGGMFSHIAGQARNHVAALDGTSGVASSWNPNANGFVYAVDASGSVVYVGGEFSSIGGQTRNNVAAVSAASGAPTSWNPNADGRVHNFLPTGGTVYLAGQFHTVGGQTRNYLAAVNDTTGALESWNPNPDGVAIQMALSGSNVWVAGDFGLVGGDAHANIAAIDQTTGQPTAWSPSADSTVDALALSGSTLYVGGTFTQLNGQARANLGALDTGTGALSSWNPAPDGNVFSLLLNGSVLYAGGLFGHIGGASRNNLAALSTSNAQATSWNPNPDERVLSMALNSGGNLLYVGGGFSNIGSAARNNLAALDTTSGAANAWDPNANSMVFGLSLSGNTMYLAGWFTKVGGQDRMKAAAVDATSGALSSWNPNVSGGDLSSVVASGGSVYVGGYFNSVGGAARNYLAALDPTTGAAQSWNPNPDQRVWKILSNGSILAIGGQFSGISGKMQRGFAEYGLSGVPGPTVTKIQPNQGPTAGGTSVVITGTNFQSGAQVFIGGQAATVTSVTSTQIDAATPAHSAGVVDVTVTNPDSQSGTLTGGFTYLGPAPTIDSISPTSGPTAGGTSVTILGGNFVTGAAVTIDGQACTSITIVNAGKITAVTPPGTAGAKDVKITNPDSQSATLTGGFTYIVPAPTIDSISPTSGPTAGGTAVTILGNNFLTGAAVTIGGQACTSISVVSATKITAITPAGTAGAKDVKVTNSDNQSATLTGGFTYIAPAPAIGSISPTSGPTAGGTAVTILGANFVAGAAVTIGGQACTSITVVTAGKITATTPAGTVGAKDVKVTNPDNQSATLTGGFTYVAPAPTLDSISPTSGPTAGGTAVTILGSNFVSGAIVTIGGQTCASITVVNAGKITATTPAGTAGAKDVKVTNPDNQSATLTAGFTYITPAPTLGSISPTSGPTSGGTFVTLSGNNFVSGAGITIGGQPCVSVTFVDPTTLTALTPAGTAGAKDVKVTNPDNQSATLTGGFTYTAVTASSPTLTSISPTSGPAAGGTVVTLTGTHFVSGATVRFGGSAATSVTFVDAQTLKATTPAGSAGAVDVTVINPDSQSSVLSQAFTYIAAAPTLASLSPSTGPVAGGTVVVVKGTHFVNGAVVDFGTTAATSVTFVDAQTLWATTPAHAAGVVDVKVTNPDNQSATLSRSFTFVAPAPNLVSLSPTTGPAAGGTVVTLTGTQFLSGATVRFGATAATSVTFVDAQTLKATTPAGNGAVDVTVVNPDSQSTSLSRAFTFVAPAPTLTSLSPTSGPVAGGTVVTLSGTGFANGATVSFGGTAATTVQFVSAQEVRATSPAHVAGAVDVTLTNPDAQNATLTAGFTFTKTAVSQPTLTSVTPGAGPVGGGTTVSIAGSQFQAGATVRFGSVPAASVTFVDASHLTVVTPAGAEGPVSVAVFNPDGGSIVVPDAFLYVAQAGPLANEVKLYPNPFHASQQSAVTIQLPPGSTITLITAAGRQVREMTDGGAGQIQWDVRNDDGDALASGDYIYRVLTPGGAKIIGQMVVIR